MARQDQLARLQKDLNEALRRLLKPGFEFLAARSQNGPFL